MKKATTHFLLLSRARTMSIPQVMSMPDAEVRDLFRQLRWPGGEPTCPRCGCEAHYSIPQRHQFRCKHCNHTYSVTSATVFASHKLPLRIYLLAILLFANAAKGVSALQLARDLGMHYKSAFVLAHKLRHALAEHRDVSAMSGEVEIDGGYTGSYIRPANRAQDRADRRSAETPNKRCILVLRERGKDGASRTITDVARSETSPVVHDFVTSHVSGKSRVFSDENAAYDGLTAWYAHSTVNHSIEYRAEDGSNTNQAESYFLRFRRLERGQVHRISPDYLESYASEIAWREDTRRMDNGAILANALGKALRTPAPESFHGYWQGKGRRPVLMAA